MYSQFEEEQYILAAFKDRKEPGRLLDIGSWDPKQFSNSRALIELGWSAVLIEPSPWPMISLIKEYGKCERVTLVQCAMGFRIGLMSLHITPDAISTSDDAEYARWKDHAEFHGKLTVPSVTWEQITNQFGGFDMVSLDTEGTSVDLFHRMLALDIKPKCCCVEFGDRLAEMCSGATRHGYKLTYSNGTNAVFTR
ncbi:MAG TPA: hypothetical protein VFO46_02335 [Candidatus Sulfotelmatobacter sp.]|nr:hypothetical protein [Candidatus Sulfotelmatobacter sp.]